MSAPGRFRPAMAWLHAWAGLAVGWVLFAIFVTGTASYYRADITRWMRPELTETAADAARAATLAGDHLARNAADAVGWYVELPTPEAPVVQVHWWRDFEGPFHRALLDPATGAPAAVRDTRGGDFLYRFHFELSMPPLWGRWIVGLCAMVLLVALVSGVITHRRLFIDLFTFRRRADQRGWLDAHNVTGVLALPFHLMITYTGLATLMLMYVPWGVQATYGEDRPRFFAESGQITAPRPAADRPGTLAPVGPMVRAAMAAVPGPLERLSIQNPRDANATVVAVFEEPPGLSHEHPQVAFDGTTGALLEVRAGGLRPAARTFTTMVGLHEAHFAGPALRVLFFLCGLAGCAMTATGVLLWSVARLPKAGSGPSLGLRLVQILNVGTVAGLTGAVAAYFLANRLLPAGVPGRADWEVRAFFAVWGAFALLALLRPQRRAWPEALAVAAGLYAAVCAADLLRLAAAGGAVEPAFLVFDGAMLALSALLALASGALAKRGTPRPRGALLRDGRRLDAAE